ncbi:MAG: hypothetical protein WAZ38_00735 [Prolixibacteraceae bacterium]
MNIWKWLRETPEGKTEYSWRKVLSRHDSAVEGTSLVMIPMRR